MKNKDILDAMNDIDFDMVEDAVPKPRRSAKTLWIRYGIVAACFGLLISLLVGLSLGLYHNGEDDTVTNDDIGDPHDPNEPIVDPPNQYPIYGGEEVLPQFPFPDGYQLSIKYPGTAYLGFYEEGTTYTFTSSNESVAKVDQYGVIEGIDNGETTITVTAENSFGKKQIEILVTVIGGPWKPMTPIDHEVSDIILGSQQSSNVTWFPKAVNISQNILQILTSVDKRLLEDIDMYDCENIYFDIYYYLYDVEEWEIRYKKVTLHPYGTYENPLDMCYRLKFYDLMKEDIVEDVKYGTIIVMRVGNTRIGYGHDTLTWSESFMSLIEYALSHPDEIEV